MEGESMSEWKEVRLGDISTMKYGKLPPKNNIGEIPIYSGYKIIGYNSVSNCNKGTIIIVARGVGGCGDVKIIKNNCFLTNLSISVELDNNICLPIYFYYRHLLNNLSFLNTGSAQPQITIESLQKYNISLPTIKEQKEIAGILSSLDAKIETNNKLNEKLEEMAQAIFKSWFVDFEPFKDKPFHETEIGYIPQIFESGVLGDLCTFKRGKGLLSKDAIFGNVPVIAGGMKPACYHNIANTKAPVVTVSGSGANAGYTQIHNVDVWASDCSFIDSNCENLYYVYCFLSRRPKLLRHSQTGAAQPHVKPADIHRFQVVIPTKDVINEFQQIVKHLFDRIGMNKKENDRLASLRDTLLPRLMSGELIV